VDGGTVGHQQRARLHEIDALGHLEKTRRRHGHLLAQTTAADARDHAVADLPTGHAFAQRGNSAADLATRAEGPGRLELVQVLDDQRIGIVDRTGRDIDQHLARAGHGGFDILDHQRFGATGLLRQYGFHVRLPLLFSLDGRGA